MYLSPSYVFNQAGYNLLYHVLPAHAACIAHVKKPNQHPAQTANCLNQDQNNKGNRNKN